VFWDELYVYPFLTSTPSSTSGSPRSPACCCSTATADCPRHGRRHERPATEARCSRGRAAATAPRRPRSSTSNPLSGQWEPDHSHNQRHVNAAIFYNVWQYYQATDDLGFPAQSTAQDRRSGGHGLAIRPSPAPESAQDAGSSAGGTAGQPVRTLSTIGLAACSTAPTEAAILPRLVERLS